MGAACDEEGEGAGCCDMGGLADASAERGALGCVGRVCPGGGCGGAGVELVQHVSATDEGVAFAVYAAGEVVAGLGSFGDVGVCCVALLRCSGSGC